MGNIFRYNPKYIRDPDDSENFILKPSYLRDSNFFGDTKTFFLYLRDPFRKNFDLAPLISRIDPSLVVWDITTVTPSQEDIDNLYRDKIKSFLHNRVIFPITLISSSAASLWALPLAQKCYGFINGLILLSPWFKSESEIDILNSIPKPTTAIHSFSDEWVDVNLIVYLRNRFDLDYISVDDVHCLKKSNPEILKTLTSYKNLSSFAIKSLPKF